MDYNTGNPVGSRSPKDLLDNSENFDELVNSPTKESHPDRLGVDRKTWHGMETDFDAAQVARQSEFDVDQANREAEWAATLAGAGYIGTGAGGAFEDYDTDGPLTIDAFNEIFTKDGEFYRAKPSTTLPYTTTGTWATDQTDFVAVGDAALRSELAAPGGARKVRDAVSKVADITELRALTGLVDGQVINVTDDGNGSSSDYEVASGSSAAEFLPYVVVATDGTRLIAKMPDGRLAAQVDLVSFIPRSELKAVSEKTSTYDCHSALVAAVAVGRRVVISMPGRYRFDTAYAGTTDFDVEANTEGVEFDLSNIVGGNGITNSGSITQIEELGSDIVKGTCTAVFASAPTLSVGDWFCIYNPTDSSYSNWRTNYRAGEWKQVLSISGSTVTTTQAFYVGYAVADVDVYRMDSVVSRLSQVHLIGGANPVGLAKFELCEKPEFDRVSFDHANNSGLLLERCVSPLVIEPRGRNIGDGGDDYGVSISNCQHARVIGGDVYGRRHAVALGGANAVCCVPTRDFRGRKIILRNDPTQSVGAADMHGNVADSSYEDCEIYGVANIGGGDENYYRRCRIYSDQDVGWCGYWREVIGGRSGFIECELFPLKNPQTNSRGILDVGGNSYQVNTNTINPCTFVVNDVQVKSETLGAATSLLLIDNRGSTEKMNVDIDRVTLDVNDLGQVLFMDLNSGTADSDFIIVDNVTGLPAGKNLANPGGAYVDFPHRLQRQSGRVEGTTTASATFIASPVSLPMGYPRDPDCFITLKPRGTGTLAGSLLGGQNPSVYAYNVNLSSIRPMIRTDAAMTAGDDFDLCWSVEIREC